MKHLHSKSIFGQLVVFSLFISLVPIIIISMFLFRKLESMVIDELADSHGQIASQYTKNIEEKLEQYRKSLEVISNNTLIVNTLENGDENVYEKGQIISEEVAKSLLLEKKNEIRNCVVYSLVAENEIYGPSVTMMEEGSREGWYLKERAVKEGWFSYFALENKQPVLSFVKNIDQVNFNDFSRRQLGIVKLDIDTKKLFEPAVQTGGEEAAYDVIVYDDSFNVFYSTNTKKDSVFSDYIKHIKNRNENDTLIQELDVYVLGEEELESYGLKLLFLFDNKELEQRKQEIVLMVFPLIISIVLIVVSCVYLYSRDFSFRIEILVNKFKTAETGDLTIRNPIEGKDEIAVLDQQFSHMLKKLDQLIKKNYIQELEHTKNYIFIQKIRLGDRLEVFYDMEVLPDQCKILRFILQPIVENAILHGLGNITGKGTLEISAFEKKDMLILKVMDDGIGMDEEKVESLNIYINSNGHKEDTKISEIFQRYCVM